MANCRVPITLYQLALFHKCIDKIRSQLVKASKCYINMISDFPLSQKKTLFLRDEVFQNI
jgi:hypothetical protein